MKPGRAAKTYGGMIHTAAGERRAVFNGTKKALAEAMGGRAVKSYVKNYWCETGNTLEVEVARAHPGVIMVGKKTLFSATSASDFEPYSKTR